MTMGSIPGAPPRVAGIETGGTKIVCAIGSGSTIEQITRFPTSASPAADLARVANFLTSNGPVAAIGIGSFGPCDPDPTSPTFGFVTTTPKPGWADTDVVGRLRDAVGDVPIAFDTDVNAAAIGESRWGAGRGVSSVVYITMGTGIGGGAVLDNAPLHGLMHPEMGHMRIPSDGFAGVCPAHGDCWEGLCSGPALAARWGRPAQELPDDHEAWDIAAHLTGRALHNLVVALSPQRIILGGGVGSNPSMTSRVGHQMVESLNGYIDAVPLLALDTYLVAPGLGAHSGVIGAMTMAGDVLSARAA